METSQKKIFILLFIIVLPFLFHFFFFVFPLEPHIFNGLVIIDNKITTIVNKSYTKNFVYRTAPLGSVNTILPSTYKPKQLESAPEVIKAIYITGWSAGSKNYLTYLEELLNTTQINAVVIDVKDSSGVMSYPSQITNINQLIKNLHDKGIYVIGRIAVFEDPVLAKKRPDLAVYDKSKTKDLAQPVLWEDRNKLSWVDPASIEVQDYNIEIAKDAISHGFDEINFDYIRFPTDGDEKNMGFPKWNGQVAKQAVVKKFFKRLREALPNARISADLFGQVTSNTDDMGIGQVWEDALPYFDYVSPMAYPSHYAKGFLGYQNPADYPYDIVKYAITSALARKKVQAKILLTNNPSKPVVLAKIRPWLQDFNLGAKYDARMVKEEIRAVQEALGTEFNGYMLWNPSNIYTKDAIVKEK